MYGFLFFAIWYQLCSFPIQKYVKIIRDHSQYRGFSQQLTALFVWKCFSWSQQCSLDLSNSSTQEIAIGVRLQMIIINDILRYTLMMICRLIFCIYTCIRMLLQNKLHFGWANVLLSAKCIPSQMLNFQVIPLQ